MLKSQSMSKFKWIHPNEPFLVRKVSDLPKYSLSSKKDGKKNGDSENEPTFLPPVPS